MEPLEIGLPELTSEQVEDLCAKAENAARKYILARVNQKLLDGLDISVEAEGTKPVSLTVEVDLALSPNAKGIDQKRLADDAVKEAFKTIEQTLRKLT
ncbi:MAG: DUF3194 domain-containing protein [Candidatus Bathyarchaeia archaeon]